jgi:thermostable 8-oxoguanine DNA glycosylase
MQPVFNPPFQGDEVDIRQEILSLEECYFRTPIKYARDSEEADAIASAAGKRIRDGQRTKENLKKIFYWKHESSRFYASRLEPAFDSNSQTDVERALALVHEAQTGCEAVAALLELKGVQVPTASAILANIYPERFTVIDRLALRALGVNNPEIAFYLLYNDECRRLAERHSVLMRSLDRALWQWGKTHPPRRPRGKPGPTPRSDST